MGVCELALVYETFPLTFNSFEPIFPAIVLATRIPGIFVIFVIHTQSINYEWMHPYGGYS